MRHYISARKLICFLFLGYSLLGLAQATDGTVDSLLKEGIKARISGNLVQARTMFELAKMAGSAKADTFLGQLDDAASPADDKKGSHSPQEDEQQYRNAAKSRTHKTVYDLALFCKERGEDPSLSMEQRLTYLKEAEELFKERCNMEKFVPSSTYQKSQTLAATRGISIQLNADAVSQLQYGLVLTNPITHEGLDEQAVFLRYDQAIKLYKKAKKFIPTACYNLGIVLTDLRLLRRFFPGKERQKIEEGEQVLREVEDARFVQLRSGGTDSVYSQLGHTHTSSEYQQFFSDAEVKERLKLGEQFLRTAVAKGEAPASEFLARSLTLNTEGLSADHLQERLKEAETIYRKRAEAGTLDSRIDLAFFLEKRLKIAPELKASGDYDEMQSLLNEATNAGNTRAGMILGEFYLRSEKHEEVKKGVEILTNAADEHGLAAFFLGMFYIDASHADFQKAIIFFQMAALKGDVTSKLFHQALLDHFAAEKANANKLPSAGEAVEPSDEKELKADEEMVGLRTKEVVQVQTFKRFLRGEKVDLKVCMVGSHERFLRKRKVVFEKPKMEKEFLAVAAREDFQSKKTLDLIDEIARRQITMGLPERLTGDLKGWNSLRVTQKHRLVYKQMNDGTIIIKSFEEHY